MRRASGVALLLVLWISPSLAHACRQGADHSLYANPPPRAEQSDYLFKGKVTRVISPPSRAYEQTATLAITRVLKGRWSSPTVDMLIHVTSCGGEVSVGDSGYVTGAFVPSEGRTRFMPRKFNPARDDNMGWMYPRR